MLIATVFNIDMSTSAGLLGFRLRWNAKRWLILVKRLLTLNRGAVAGSAEATVVGERGDAIPTSRVLWDIL